MKQTGKKEKITKKTSAKQHETIIYMMTTIEGSFSKKQVHGNKVTWTKHRKEQKTSPNC